MPISTKFGLKSKYAKTSGGAVPGPSMPIYISNPTLVNANAVSYSITSSYPNQTVYYTIVGADADDFTDNQNSGTITLNGSGSATLVKNLAINNNLNESSKSFNLTLRTNGLSGDPVATTSNVLINKYQYITATGGTEYWINNTEKLHVFTTTGTNYLNVSTIGDTSGNVRYMLVGGGGTGGYSTDYLFYNRRAYSGGGGAGQFKESNANISAANISITVGAGGAANAFNNGNNTVFGNIATAYGGGYGGALVASSTTDTHHNGGNGNNNAGSGGGGSFRAQLGGSVAYNLVDGTGGDSIDILGQALDGGVGNGNGTSLGGNQWVLSTVVAWSSGSGGGGAREVGYQGYTISGNGFGGKGGNGIESDITGSAIYYAGGGGGASRSNTAGAEGGQGGGGQGWGQGTGSAGEANKGGGGGAGGYAGGSGIAVVRYVWDNPRKFALPS